LKITNKIFFGFMVMILLLLLLLFMNNTLDSEILENTEQINNVEVPMSFLIEEIRTYDSLLTENVLHALIDGKNGDFNQIKIIRYDYDDLGTQLDDLLNVQMKLMIDKSKRTNYEKIKSLQYIDELNELNLKLVELEVWAYVALEKEDVNTANYLLTQSKYADLKTEFSNVLNEWATFEKEITANIQEQINEDSENMEYLNFIIVIIIIIFALVESFIVSNSISKPINNLKDNVDKISKGDLSIQLDKSNISEIQALRDSLNRILATMKLAILRTGMTQEEMGLGEAIKAKEVAENKFKILYDTSSAAIMTIEPPTWNFTSGNPTTLKIFGVKDEKEFTLLGPGDLSPEKQPDGQLSSIKSKKMIERAMKEGSVFFEWTHKRYKGNDFPATVLLSKIQDGEKTYLQAIVRDVTKEHELELELIESLKEFKIIYETSPMAIELYDLNGKLFDANKSCMKLFGFKSAKAVNGFDLFKDPNVTKEHIKEIKLGKAVKYTSEFDFDKVRKNKLYSTTKKGKLNLIINIVPLNGTKHIGYIVQIEEVKAK